MTTTVKSVCPYCGVGCGIVMEVSADKIVKVSGNKKHPTNFGRLCTKGNTCAQAVTESGRMEHAYLREARGEQPARTDIDHAIRETARRLCAIRDRHGPDALSFYVSGQMSLEAQYLANKLAKGFVRTNNIESNSRLCMASAGSGYKLSLGSDGPPGSYQDFDKADVFFVIGANMADCHPILFLRMMDRVKQGAKLIVVDPRRSATADKATLFLQIRPGTDLALLNGLLHLLAKNGHTDAQFIREFTEGWEEMARFLDGYTSERVAALTDLPEADIVRAAEMIGTAGNWMSCWTMGLNQSTHGTWNTNAMCNLHLATGAICRPGSGPFSLTGQPNAMGGREMGYMGPGLPGQRSVLVKKDRAFVEGLWGVKAGTLRTDVTGGTISMFESMREGGIKGCWIICTNPVATVPNRKNVIAALESAELVIAQDAFFDTETNRYADILLPGALWAEAEGVMINSERNMTLMQKAVEPPGQALPDWQIIARVACEMGYAEAFSYRSADEVFEELKQAWNPKTGYDIRGASHALLREMPLQWPYAPEAAGDRNPIRYLNNGVSQALRTHSDGTAPRIAFATDSGKGVFFARPHMPSGEMPDAEYPVVLNTGRLQHQWHTLTKTGKVPTLNKLNPGPFVEIHPEDAAALGVVDKDRVEVRSRRGKALLPAVVTTRVRPGNCFAPFHWNDLFGEHLAINDVTNDAVDPTSLQPEFKFCAVVLTRVAEPRVQTAAEHDMSPIDAFAKLLGVDSAPEITFDAHEKLYLQGYIAGLRVDGQKPFGVPILPATSPLDPMKRLFVDGMLSGLFARSWPAVAEPLALPGARAPALLGMRKTALTILWASQTGRAEGFATESKARLEAEGFDVSIVAMDAMSVSALASVARLLVITSTFGDGDPPDNGVALWSALRGENAPTLADTQFAVLAFGDSNYDQFCGFGRNLDARLEALGGKRLLPRTDCEPDFEASAKGWLSAAIDALGAGTRTVTVAELGASAAPAPSAQPTYHRANPFKARLIKNVRLNAAGADKDTRQIAFDLGDSGLQYEAGDALGVWPTNCPEHVADMLSVLKLSASDMVTLKDHGAMPLSEALLRHHEISRVTRDVLEFVRLRSGSADLGALLADERKDELKRWLWGRQIIDVLEAFPIHVDATEWLQVLKRLQPRSYSISSSPKAEPREVHLTISAVRYAFGTKPRRGVCSTFLADRAESTAVPIFVQKSAHFRPPAQLQTPLIMVGPGTGIAPFRAFLQDRKASGARGRNWLFFGERRADQDFYYREELEAFQKEGVLHRLDTAFSRDQTDKIYVQHRLIEQGAELWRWLEDGAHFCVCGDANQMAKDVDRALKEVVQTHGGMAAEGAAAYVAKMAEEKRYVRDVY